MTTAAPMLKVILLGDARVGKTSLHNVYVRGYHTPPYKCTIGCDFAVKTESTVLGRSVDLQIWDAAGQERFHSLGRAYYRAAAVALVVYDVSDRAHPRRRSPAPRRRPAGGSGEQD